MEGLFVACQDGTLVQYVLEPRPKAVASADKVSEDMPLDLGIVGQLQWSLSRSVASRDCVLRFRKRDQCGRGPDGRPKGHWSL